MKYRDAKNLHKGDEVTDIDTNEVLTINSIEVYGQYKLVRLNCLNASGTLITLYHNDVE